MKENWKKINGYNNYSVSETGKIRNDNTDRILSLSFDRDGYFKILLSKNGVVTTHKVHRLVCSAFHKNPNNKPTVNHMDGCKNNNYKDNLQWNTYSENMKHAFEIGLMTPMKGEDSGMSKLTEKQVRVIKSAKGLYKQVEIANYFGISQSAISAIQTNRTWKHVPIIKNYIESFYN